MKQTRNGDKYAIAIPKWIYQGIISMQNRSEHSLQNTLIEWSSFQFLYLYNMVLIGRAQNPPEFFTLENLETNRFMTVILKSDLR